MHASKITFASNGAATWIYYETTPLRYGHTYGTVCVCYCVIVWYMGQGRGIPPAYQSPPEPQYPLPTPLKWDPCMLVSEWRLNSNQWNQLVLDWLPEGMDKLYHFEGNV